MGKRWEKAIAEMEATVKAHRPFVFIGERGDGQINVCGGADREWLVRVLTAVLAGAQDETGGDLASSDKIVTVENVPERRQ